MPAEFLDCRLIFLHLLLLPNALNGFEATNTFNGSEICPENGVWSSSGQKCLLILGADPSSSGFQSVFEAAMKCRSIGAEIASVETNEVRSALTDLIADSTPRNNVDKFYIGLSDFEEENNFTWFDGSAHNEEESVWDKGQPNAGNYLYEEDCVVMKVTRSKTSFTWHDYPCCSPANIYAVLCQMTIQQLEEIRLRGLVDSKKRLSRDELGLAKECSINVSHCSSVECLSGGSCVEMEDGFECLCPVGFSGIRCEIAICPKEFVIENSKRKGDNIDEGSSANYTCNPRHAFPPDFQGQTELELVCRNHEWRLVTQQENETNSMLYGLRCHPVCDDPLLFDNSIRTGNSFYDGSTVQYRCHLMFELAGQFKGQEVVEVNCSGHKWELIGDGRQNNESVMRPDFISCQPVCSEPVSIGNATGSSDDRSEGSIIRYTCNEGFRFSRKLEYLELRCINHRWIVVVQSEMTTESTPAEEGNDRCGSFPEEMIQQNPDIARCHPIFCPAFPKWKGIRTNSTEWNGHRVNDRIDYHCSAGKHFVDEKDQPLTGDNLTSICLSNGSWSPNFHRCKHSETSLVPKIVPKEAPGAAAIGTVAIIFLSVELALVFLMDLEHLFRHAKMFKDNVTSGFHRITSAIG